MSIDARIKCGIGTNHAIVDDVSALRVSQADPPLLERGKAPNTRFFAGYLSTSGIVGSSTNALMQVNGNNSPVEFFVEADNEADLHITHAIIIIADNNVVHNNFGNISSFGLTGWDLKIEQGGQTTFLIEKAVTGGQVIAQAGSFWPIGTGAASHELVNWSGTTDAQLINFPFINILPMGLTLARGSTDRFVSVVNDNFTDLTEFTVRVLGYKRFPS